MSTKKPATKVRNLVLPADVDAALVKAAKASNRSARAHAAHLLAVALGFACLILAGCSGDASGPLVDGERHADAGTLLVGPDGQACGAAGGACCVGGEMGTSNWSAYCPTSAGVPCSINLTCEACGGVGQVCCAAVQVVIDSGVYPQPSYCSDMNASGCSPSTHACEACGAAGQPCCNSVTAACRNGTLCNGATETCE
jgi:hypothetical protein